MKTAVIFYDDEKWNKEYDDAFDVRYDAQTLPAGSVVCGFMKAGGQEIFDFPSLTELQTSSLVYILEQARQVLR